MASVFFQFISDEKKFLGSYWSFWVKSFIITIMYIITSLKTYLLHFWNIDIKINSFKDNLQIKNKKRSSLRKEKLTQLKQTYRCVPLKMCSEYLLDVYSTM